MGEFVDMTGWIMSEHGVPDSRLTVVEKVDSYNKRGWHVIKWKCICSCGSGKHVIASRTNLQNGCTLSCGCIRNERSAQRGHEMWTKRNSYKKCDDYYIGYTTKNEEFYFDLDDYDKVKDYCWSLTNEGYVHAQYKDKKIVKMHRLILDFPTNCDIDHINHNKSDNRKNNLRICAHVENMINQLKRSDNTSGVSGVNYHTKNNVWVARIGVNEKRIYLGSFADFEDAVKARLNAENKYYGEFAPQQHLFEQYGIARHDDCGVVM